MESDTSRSEQVIADYKKRKLAASALRRIQSIVHGFEQDRATDARFAVIGVAIVILLIAIAAYFFLNTGSVTIS